jgi:hypothetical protein
MKRPAQVNSEYRLDRILLKKAKEGVDIYILMYKEFEYALPNASFYAKRVLSDLHPNIRVQRSPGNLLLIQ